ncbi:MAG: lysylphosphatidylglycerol synthase transmembrane domain-containing protein [Gemmobacter sp.]|nr:lysylphosphatidylglycerol synthase transmembrane domain-containing protein [Gemmobacter sp.]
MNRLNLPPFAKRGAQFAVATGLLVVLWHVADGAQAAQTLAGADPVWLGAAMVALTMQTVLSALRWRLTAAQLGIALGRWTAIREYYLSQIVNQALPGGVIGDASRAMRTRQAAGLMASGQAVVFERLAGQIALFAVMVLGFVTTLTVPGGVDWPVWAIWSMGGLMAAGLAVPGLLWALARAGIAHSLKAQAEALKHALFAPKVRGRQIRLSLGTVLCNIAGFGFCAWAVGVTLPVPAMLAVVPLILTAMVIPITISGWGLREGAAAALFPVAGATASDGLATSIAFGLVFLATVLPGTILIGIGTRLRPVKF